MRRLSWLVVVLFCVSIITFLLAFAVPGDPAKSIAGVHATPEVLERIRAELGLDEPVYEQYWIYLTNLLQGDMGFSYETQRHVAQSMIERFRATAMSALFGILFELLIGIPVGMVSALKQYSVRDRTFTVLSLLGIAAPPSGWACSSCTSSPTSRRSSRSAVTRAGQRRSTASCRV